jgi:hypothetical protein
MKDEVTLTIEELVWHYVDHSHGKDTSDIVGVQRNGDEVTISFINRELVEKTIKHVENYMYGEEKALLLTLLKNELEDHPGEKKEEVGNGELPTEREIVVDRFDSPTYGDLQSPAAEKLRAGTPEVDGTLGRGSEFEERF